MQIDIMTLFPDNVSAVLGESIIGKGQKNGFVEIACHQIRDYTTNKQHQVDDYPYGGSQGMVMQADPLYRCHKAVLESRGKEHIHTILMSAQGARYDQNAARRLAALDGFILVCGHYEGVDQRFIDECVDEEISLGDFVLSGGEIAAMAVADSVCRLVPGVLSEEACFTDESYWCGRLEYPQYSRPEVWHRRAVPDVLLSGHHANIDAWRRRQSLVRTAARRPDLLRDYPLTEFEEFLITGEKKKKKKAKPQPESEEI